jgi:hypothetical protein
MVAERNKAVNERRECEPTLLGFHPHLLVVARRPPSVGR